MATENTAEVEQKSSEWHDLRNGRVTASRAGTILGNYYHCR